MVQSQFTIFSGVDTGGVTDFNDDGLADVLVTPCGAAGPGVRIHEAATIEADRRTVSRFLSAVKRPVSANVKQALADAGSPLLTGLTIRERPGRMAFRFWQEGGG